MIIDAKNLVVGRLASFAAKKALLGEKIDIINIEKAVIVGNKKNILEKYKRKRYFGDALKGPFFSKTSERIAKRIIRGMLPYKQEKGRNALKNIKCYISIPKDFEGKNFETLDEANITKRRILRYLRIEDLAKAL